MADNIARATPKQLQRLLGQIERIATADRKVVRVIWTPAAPFFAPAVRLMCS